MGESPLFLLEDPEQFQSATGVLRYLDGSIPGGEDGYEHSRWREMCLPWSPECLEHTAYLARRTFFGREDPRISGSAALFDALAG